MPALLWEDGQGQRGFLLSTPVAKPLVSSLVLSSFLRSPCPCPPFIPWVQCHPLLPSARPRWNPGFPFLFRTQTDITVYYYTTTNLK